MSIVDGWVAAGWDALRDGFASGQHDDPGYAQLAVYQHGRLVADLWASQDGRGGDHVGILMSVSKGLVATCAHMLAEQGDLDFDSPVAAYWPEFATAGKHETTVADLLSHRAGLVAFDPDGSVSRASVLNWADSVGRLARRPPAWPPGRYHLYHPFTFGHLVGAVIERVSGHDVGTFFHQRVAAPLGLSAWIGLPAEIEPRFVAQFRSVDPPTPEQVRHRLTALGIETGTRLGTALMAMMREGNELTELFGTRAGRAAQVPAANAVGDARSVARFYAAVIDEVDGVRLLSEPALVRALQPQTDGVPSPGPLAQLDGPDRTRFGLGFELPRPGLPMLGPHSFGHAGAGGRLAFADRDSGIAVAYTCTNMAWDSAIGPDPRWTHWTQALRRIVSAHGN